MDKTDNREMGSIGDSASSLDPGSLGLGFDGRYWHAPLAEEEIGRDNGGDPTIGRKRWLQTD